MAWETMAKILSFMSNEYLEQRRKKTGLKKQLSKKVAENFQSLTKDRSLQVQEAEQTLNMVSPKELMPKCIKYHRQTSEN